MIGGTIATRPVGRARIGPKLSVMYALALSAFVLVAASRLALSWLNLRHQKREGQRVPAGLEAFVDAERLVKIAAYTRERAQVGLVHGAFTSLAYGAFLFGGGLGWYDAQVTNLAPSFVLGSVLFVLGVALASSVMHIPFQLYGDFRVEARHGFNRQTARLWWADWLKGSALSLVLTAALAAGAFWLVAAAPTTWWLWVTALVAMVSVLLTFAAPYVIEPLFHRMEPLSEGSLADTIRDLTERAGVKVARVLKVDASRRSSHSNAYFTGLGRVKRVVLYDTLLWQMTEPQILSVLAHELGHWKKHHVLVRMLFMLSLLTLGAYAAFWLTPSGAIPELVGLGSASFAARLAIVSALASTLLFPLTPLLSAWSRRDERQADRYAVELHGRPDDLADALAKLGAENLSNLHPHKLYAAFYYSHPPLTERIASLRALASAGTGSR